MRIVEQVLVLNAAEVALARAEDDRHDVHGDLLHEPGSKDLASDVAGVYGDGALAGQVLSFGDRGGHVINEMVGRLGVPAFGLGPVGHHDHVVARRRVALHPLTRSNR